MKKILFFVVLMIMTASVVFAAEELTLSKSVDIAVNNNPSIIDANEKVRAADARLGQAFGAMLPNISVSANYGSAYMQPSSMVFGGTTFLYGTEEVATNSGYTLNLNQPLFMSGKLMNGLDIAKAGLEAVKQDYRKTRIDLAFNVVSTYYGVLRAQKLHELSKESLDMAKSHLDQVNAMYTAGISTKADVLRSEVQLANSEQVLTKAKNGFELSKNAFNNTIARDLDSPVDLSEKEFTIEPVSIKDYAELMGVAFKNRPDWLSFELSKGIGEKSLYIAYGGYLPNILLIGSYGNAKREYPTYISTDQNSWTLMATASWTVFDGLSTQSKIAEADAGLKSLIANENNLKNVISLDVKDASLNINSARDVVVSAKKGVDSAVENHQIAELKYKNGAASNLEVIDAQVALTQAKTNLYQAQFDLQIAKARLNKAVGVDIYKLY